VVVLGCLGGGETEKWGEMGRTLYGATVNRGKGEEKVT
jgi:hypothetical protein